MYINPQVKVSVKDFFNEMHSGEISYPLKLMDELPPMQSFEMYATLDWVKEHADELGIIVDSEGFYIKK